MRFQVIKVKTEVVLLKGSNFCFKTSMSQLFAFQWHITDTCDQRCKHCYIFAENTNKSITSMTFEQMKIVIENCIDFCNKFNRQPYFYITGGDPILHENFWELLEIVKEKNIEFTILGNPFHLTDEVCKNLKSYGCEQYQMSLDGLKQTHDWFRKNGSFDATLEKIKCIKNAGINSVIMATVSGKNINEILELIDIVVKYKVDTFAFARYCATSLEKDINIDGIFIAIGEEPKNEIFSNVVDIDEKGYIKSDDGVHTKTPGIYVAGDTRVKELRQQTTAESDGSIAATVAIKELK